MPQDLVVTPATPLVNLDTLIDAAVVATPFDDPVFKTERHVGTIDEVKITRLGTFVRFSSPALVGKKWIKLTQVQGFVSETQTTAA